MIASLTPADSFFISFFKFLASFVHQSCQFSPPVLLARSRSLGCYVSVQKGSENESQKSASAAAVHSRSGVNPLPPLGSVAGSIHAPACRLINNASGALNLTNVHFPVVFLLVFF